MSVLKIGDGRQDIHLSVRQFDKLRYDVGCISIVAFIDQGCRHQDQMVSQTAAVGAVTGSHVDGFLLFLNGPLIHRERFGGGQQFGDSMKNHSQFTVVGGVIGK